MGDLEDEDGNIDNNEGGEGKGGATTTPSTKKNAMRKDKKNSATTAAKKNNKKKKPPPLLGGSICSPPGASLGILLVRSCRIGRVHVLRMPRPQISQAPMAVQRWGGIGGSRRDDKIYDDVLSLDDC